MANPQMFVEVVASGGQAAVTVVGHGDDLGDAFGDDEDFVIVLNADAYTANATITDVLVGTQVTPGLAANSAILSNTTASGDILFAVADASGNSQGLLMLDGSTGRIGIGGIVDGVDKILHIESADPVLKIQDSSGNGNTANAIIGFHSADGTEMGFVGDGTAANSDIYLHANAGNLRFKAEASSTVLIEGTTPTLTIGDAGAEDAAIIFDGAAADYHIGLEDATDNLVIGIDQVLGTKQVITINDDGHMGFGGTDPSVPILFLFNADARSVPAGYGEVSLVAISGSNTLTLATGATGLASSLILYPPNIVEAGGDGVTNTATVFIGRAATEGSAGNYSLWVDADSVRLDGSLWVEGTPTEGSAGEQLTSGGADTVMSWAAASSLGQFKDTIDVLSPEDALDKIVSWIPKSFRYKADAEMSTHDYDTTYVGVYGEDAPEVMHHEGRIFSPVSAFGYTVGAIQELHNKIQKLETQLAAS